MNLKIGLKRGFILKYKKEIKELKNKLDLINKDQNTKSRKSFIEQDIQQKEKKILDIEGELLEKMTSLNYDIELERMKVEINSLWYNLQEKYPKVNIEYLRKDFETDKFSKLNDYKIDRFKETKLSL